MRRVLLPAVCAVFLIACAKDAPEPEEAAAPAERTAEEQPKAAGEEAAPEEAVGDEAEMLEPKVDPDEAFAGEEGAEGEETAEAGEETDEAPEGAEGEEAGEGDEEPAAALPGEAAQPEVDPTPSEEPGKVARAPEPKPAEPKPTEEPTTETPTPASKVAPKPEPKPSEPEPTEEPTTATPTPDSKVEAEPEPAPAEPTPTEEPTEETPESEPVQASAGKKVFLSQGCNKCHSVKSKGISRTGSADEEGPDLSGVGRKHDKRWIAKYLMKAETLDGEKHKKKFYGSKEELKVVATWVGSL